VRLNLFARTAFCVLTHRRIPAIITPMELRVTGGGRAGVTGMALLLVASCSNNPYRPDETAESAYFSTFATPPTKLDPTSAYYSHEGAIIDQIYEPPFTYHYLKRPYELVPMTATAIPAPVYLDAGGAVLPETDATADRVKRVQYTIKIQPGIRYQDHPCFARTPDGRSVYADAAAADLEQYEYPSSFPEQASRTLKAADYALQIRRLADPRLASPIFSTVARYVEGLTELQQTYTEMIEAARAARREAAGAGYNQEQDEKANPLVIDYMAPELPGCVVVDELTYRITLTTRYPQILYWMSMHFFAPVPQEAIDFYALPSVTAAQFSLNRCPVGTGAYYLETFRPNELIVLEENPNYHGDVYPSEGEPGDREAGLLVDAGKPVPFIRRQVYRMEKEAIPSWNKFLQGYVDASGIASDVFDQAIEMAAGNDPSLSPAMAGKGMRLLTDIRTMLWWTAFNFKDDVVGGLAPERFKLRQAISIALDYNEHLDVFFNGRGLAAQGPIPPGIYGYRAGEAGTNPFTDVWDPIRAKHVRQPIEEARQLMVEAGYPDGLTPDGQPLTLYLDHAAGLDPQFRSRFQWMQRGLDRIGIKLKERGTDLSRFRAKRNSGEWQISSSGWLADYPDPENFLFLFYGPNGKVDHGGPNTCNYASEEFDELFRQLETMNNGPERMALIDRAMHVIQRDAPAVWQFYPVSFSLAHQWYHNFKPHQMSYSTVRFRRIDAATRVRFQAAWNRPRWEIVAGALAVLVVLGLPGMIRVWRSERRSA
jgi:ABC-type transport system substrate-binding protein